MITRHRYIIITEDVATSSTNKLEEENKRSAAGVRGSYEILYPNTVLFEFWWDYFEHITLRTKL